MPPMHTVNRQPLAGDWNQRRPDGYDVVIIGSGYGGAITAARLATAQWPGAKPTLCLLERGKEWLPGQFPDDILAGGQSIFEQNLNPLGLYKLQAGADIVAIMGSGLGGTSLINANVAIQPDDDVFDDPRWPQAIRDSRDAGQLQQFYDRVRFTLNAGQHPDGNALSKVKAMQKGAQGDPEARSFLLDIAVNFQPDGPNRWQVEQRKCINCGDCVTGCNVGAKNTLDTNYLAIASFGGAALFTQVEVLHLEKDPAGGYTIHYLRRSGAPDAEERGTMHARRAVVLSAGSIGSTEILLRSRALGLSLPDTVGARFSGNGDFFGLAYNSDQRTDVLGWGAYPTSGRALRLQPGSGQLLHPGPTIVSAVRYNENQPLPARVTIEDLSFPLMYVDAARAAFAVISGRDTDPDDFIDNLKEFGRRTLDFAAINPALERGALNHTLLYLVMGIDNASGTITLDPLTQRASIHWPGAGQQALIQLQNSLIARHATGLGSTIIENPLWGFSPWRTLATAHPLGGCPMGETHAQGAVNHLGQAFDQTGGLHDGLYVTDASIVPAAIGVNPFLTISALSERVAESIVTVLGGVPSVIASIP
ncbi:MAG: GMC family oxidoreductase [Acidobacteria bacterium]|nr:GMC family oxidoreductase [Acidobacteriota bacterium]